MSDLRKYGRIPLEAWTDAVSSVPAKILLLCVIGSLGVVLGQVFLGSIPATFDEMFLVVVYPYHLLLNCFDFLGIGIAILFFLS